MTSQAKVQEALKQCGKLLQTIMTNKDAGPFLEPVNWKEWGLLDYPKVIKTPMDLGTIKRKLERGDYNHPREFKHDVNLVWTNCMTYNADGSDYYNVALNFKKIFDERYTKSVKDDEDQNAEQSRPPTLVDKKMFSQNIYNITSEDLGRLIQVLDQRCESCIKKIDPEDIEIDIDAIDAATFWVADSMVRDWLPGTKKSKNKSTSSSTTTTGGASSVSKGGASSTVSSTTLGSSSSNVAPPGSDGKPTKKAKTG